MNNENSPNSPSSTNFPKGKPVISIVRFLDDGQYENIGTVWDNYRPKGVLDLKLNLTKIPKDQPTMRFILFPKDDFKNQVVSKLLNNRENVQEIQSEKFRERPLYDCVIWINDKRHHVGAIWYNKKFTYLELQLHVYLIPKEFSENISIALFPNVLRPAKNAITSDEKVSVMNAS